MHFVNDRPIGSRRYEESSFWSKAGNAIAETIGFLLTFALAIIVVLALIFAFLFIVIDVIIPIMTCMISAVGWMVKVLQ